MTAFSFRCTLAGLLLPVAGATGSPADELVLAAMRWSDAAGYGWRTVVTDDADTYQIEGRAEPGGLTWQCQPLPRALARKVGRPIGSECEAYFLGSDRWVIATERGWLRQDELPRRHRNWQDDDEGSFVQMPTPALFDSGDPAASDPLGAPVMVYVPPPHESETKPFSNYRFGRALPHEELAIIVNNFGDLEVAGDAMAGSISDLGAQLLLLRDGDDKISTLAAEGTFKLWIRDRAVVKYSLRLAAVLAVNRKRIQVRQDSTTTVMATEAFAAAVPDEVRTKLGL